MDELLNPDGFLVIIAPFAFRDHPDYSLFIQAEWKLASVMGVIDQLNGKIIYQAMARQIGVENIVAKQAQTLDWFLAPDDGHCENRFSGHYLASWTIVITPPRTLPSKAK